MNVETVRQVAPYAVWMLLMTVLPSTAWAYAVRTAATLAVLLWALKGRWAAWRTDASWAKSLGWGVLVGVAVCVLWVYPDRFTWYREWFIVGDTDVSAPGSSPFDPAVCGWPLTIVRLLGSAFVIAAAEEIFFRKWLIGFAGFWWMVGLFAIEHDRWLVGAIAGAVYGWLYLRKGLGSAIVAHMVTNLLLGLWVIREGAWAFW